MEFSPSDIRNRSFSKSLRGLEEEEVYTFLNDLADQWDRMVRRRQDLQDRIQTLESKLDAIDHEEVEALQEELDAKEQRLKEKERELDEAYGRLETKQAKLRTVVQRLQDTMEEQQRTLSSLAPENGRADREASASGAANEDTEDRDTSSEKSKEEWVDSLFPNRLPENEPTEAARDSDEAGPDEPTDEISARETQFEAIKEDVQDMGSDGADRGSTSKENEEDESSSTEEVNRIWDVLEQTERE